MEEKGVVGPLEGSKPRQLLITKEQWQEMQCRQNLSVPAGLEPTAQTMSAPPFDTEEALDRAEEDNL